MSAQQRERAVARPDVDDHRLARARSRREPDSWPTRRLRAVGDDHVVGQLAAVLLADAPASRARTSSHGEPGAQLADQLARRRPSPRRRPSGRGGCPSSSASVLTPPARRRTRRRRRSARCPPARRWSATASGKSGGTSAALDARARGTRAARSRPRSRRRRRPCVEQLVAAERVRVEHLDAQRRAPCRRRARDHGRDAAAVVLDVEERVDDRRRDRVEEVGRALGRAVDQDGRQARGSPPAAPAPRARGACSGRSRRPRRGRARRPARPRAASRSGVCVSHACWASRWTIR